MEWVNYTGSGPWKRVPACLSLSPHPFMQNHSFVEVMWFLTIIGLGRNIAKCSEPPWISFIWIKWLLLPWTCSQFKWSPKQNCKQLTNKSKHFKILPIEIGLSSYQFIFHLSLGIHGSFTPSCLNRIPYCLARQLSCTNLYSLKVKKASHILMNSSFKHMAAETDESLVVYYWKNGNHCCPLLMKGIKVF